MATEMPSQSRPNRLLWYYQWRKGYHDDKSCSSDQWSRESCTMPHTFTCQPVDVRVNKKLKTIVCKYWEGLMLDSGINVSVIKPSTPQLIVALVINACDSISVDIVQHSWRHGVYFWYHSFHEVFMCIKFCC